MSIFLIIYLIYCFFAYYTVHKHFERLEYCHSKLTSEETIKYRAFVRNDFNKYSKLNTYVGAMVLLPIRLLFLTLTFLGCFVFILSFKPFYQRNNFLYQSFFMMINLFVRITLFGFGFYQLPIKKLSENKENRQYSRAPIIISNHTSFFDVWILYCQFNCSFLASVETKAFPLVQQIGEISQTIYVDRFDTDQSKITNQLKQRTLLFKNKNLQETNQIKPLVIFPEGYINQLIDTSESKLSIKYNIRFQFKKGTCTNNRHIASFKKGAFQNMTPLTIAIIEYSHERYNPMIDSHGTLTSLFFAMCQFQNIASMKYHEYITPESLGIKNLTEDNWKEYADKVQQFMSNQGDFTIVDGGIRSCFELMHLFRNM